MPDSDDRPAQLEALAAHFARRRGALMQAWRTAVASDPALSSGTALPRSQLQDHLPALLTDLERSLRGQAGDGVPRADAAAHGLHRWQQGFGLAEVARELGLLNECVVAEFEACAAQHTPAALAAARQRWATLHTLAIGASTAQYFKLQQLESRGQVRELEEALEGLHDLERERALLWQQAAHDLRGNLGLVVNASAALATTDDRHDRHRQDFLALLDRNVTALHRLLDDVTTLARLQGGQEARRLAPTDVAPLLQDLCEALRETGRRRGLTLRSEGPEPWPVMTDGVKLQRIAQNLVLNALRYTREGGVTVGWGPLPDDDERWCLEVADTGPGLPSGSGAALTTALEAATNAAEKAPRADAPGSAAADVAASTAAGAPAQGPGEGLGLSIVKRLCELLDGTVEVESAPGVGTRFRVLLPRRYGP